MNAVLKQFIGCAPRTHLDTTIYLVRGAHPTLGALGGNQIADWAGLEPAPTNELKPSVYSRGGFQTHPIA